MDDARSVRCIHCGHSEFYAVTDASEKQRAYRSMCAHDVICERHPLRRVIVEQEQEIQRLCNLLTRCRRMMFPETLSDTCMEYKLREEVDSVLLRQ